MKSNSNDLELFIRRHRAEFDTAGPDAHHWPSLEKALDRLPTADSLEQYVLLHRALFDTAEPSGSVWSGIEQALDSAPKDSLEQFIRENRDAFDAQTPDLRVWAAVEQSIPAKAAKVVRVHWYRTLLRAAASVALLIAGIGIGMWYARTDGATQGSGMAMSDVSSEYAELEQYYQRDITSKKEKLATLASYRDDGLNDDLVQMDQVMSELRQDLADVPPGNREMVVRAMIENYKAKAAILERVLESLEQQQQQQPATTNSRNHEVRKI